MMISGTTRVISLLGHPIEQVHSPTVFNSYARDAGVDAVLVALDIPPDGIDDYFKALRAWKNSPGCLVTIPHKQAALANSDEATGRARRIGAANIVLRDKTGKLFADMLDGVGFVSAMAKSNISPKGKRMLQIGGGGAGSAIADAVAEAGLAHLSLIEIDDNRRDRLLRSLRETYPKLGLSAEPGDPGTVDIMVNASPVGMKPDDPLPFALDNIRSGTLVCDIVTKPPTTAFLEAAISKGCTVQRGNEMAEAQLALITKQFGFPAPAGIDT